MSERLLDDLDSKVLVLEDTVMEIELSEVFESPKEIFDVTSEETVDAIIGI